MKKLTVIAASVLAASIAAPVANAATFTPTAEFNGYARSSVGSSRDGAQIEHKKNYLGRLGNEADSWADLGLSVNAFKYNDLSFKVESMVSIWSDGAARGENFNDKANSSFEQLNLQVKGAIPSNKDAVLWGGKRHYQREDIHITDNKYYNVSGIGGGLEYLQVGPGKLSLAWTRNDADGFTYRTNDIHYANGWKDDGTYHPNYWYDKYKKDENEFLKSINVNYFDARYAGWAPWDGAWTEFGFTYAMPRKGETDDRNGKAFFYNGYNGSQFNLGDAFMITAQISQNFAAGFNQTIVQYTTGGLAHHAIDMGDSWMDFWNNSDNSKGLNIINTGEIALTENFRFMHEIAYGVQTHVSEDYTTTYDALTYNAWPGENYHSGAFGMASANGFVPTEKKRLFKAVVRPSYQLTEYTRILAELGAYWEKTEYGANVKSSTDRGQKVTIAYAIAPSKEIKSRPELRFFFTYLHSSDWNREDGWDKGISNHDGDKRYEDNYMYGISAEAWW